MTTETWRNCSAWRGERGPSGRYSERAGSTTSSDRTKAGEAKVRHYTVKVEEGRLKLASKPRKENSPKQK